MSGTNVPLSAKMSVIVFHWTTALLDASAFSKQNKLRLADTRTSSGAGSGWRESQAYSVNYSGDFYVKIIWFFKSQMKLVKLMQVSLESPKCHRYTIFSSNHKMYLLGVSPNLVSRWRKVYSFWGMYVYEDRKFKISEALPCWLSQPSSHLDTKSLKKNPEF